MLVDYKAKVRMQHTIINCLMKMMDGIQAALCSIKIDHLLLKMHLYLITINPKDLTKYEEKGMRVVQTLVDKIVLEIKDSVFEYYDLVRHHEVKDHYLKKWIRFGLKSQ